MSNHIGYYRNKILECLDDLSGDEKDSIKNIINEIEQDVIRILDDFHITGIGELYKLENAKDELKFLKDKLY